MEWTHAYRRWGRRMKPQLSARAHEVISGDETPIFLATLDVNGRPNCVPVITILPYEDDKLIFGEFMMNKSRTNLETDKHVGVAVFSDAFEAWSIKGTFLGFEDKGPRFDFMNNTPAFRYNAYTGVRAAGLIRIDEVSEPMVKATWQLPPYFLRAKVRAMISRRYRSDGRCMPLQVEEKFNRLSAIRALAFKDTDDYPRTFPMLSCFSAGSESLAISDPFLDHYRSDIKNQSEVAISVLTAEAISYQVKGRYAARGTKTSMVQLMECYSASPPLLGDRLDIP